jgi:hypothetical protein
MAFLSILLQELPGVYAREISGANIEAPALDGPAAGRRANELGGGTKYPTLTYWTLIIRCG